MSLTSKILIGMFSGLLLGSFISINYFLNSLSIVGKLDSAKYYSKILHDKYPNLKFNSQFYDDDNKNNINKKEKKTKIGVNYSVEVALYET